MTVGDVTDGKHECPGADCDVRLDFEVFACRRHWFKLPRRIRNAITSSWLADLVGEYQAAHNEGVTWLEEHP